MGDLGVIAIANNLLKLTDKYTLRDSDDNNVGDSGVTAISNKLNNLTHLAVGA